MSTKPSSTMIQEVFGADAAEIQALAQELTDDSADNETTVVQVFPSGPPISIPDKAVAALEGSPLRNASIPLIQYPVLSPTGHSSPPSSEHTTRSSTESEYSTDLNPIPQPPEHTAASSTESEYSTDLNPISQPSFERTTGILTESGEYPSVPNLIPQQSSERTTGFSTELRQYSSVPDHVLKPASERTNGSSTESGEYPSVPNPIPQPSSERTSGSSTESEYPPAPHPIPQPFSERTTRFLTELEQYPRVPNPIPQTGFALIRGNVSSPLNPSSPTSAESITSRPVVFGQAGRSFITRVPSEDARAFGFSSTGGTAPRGSMILYRLRGPSEVFDATLSPRIRGNAHRDSTASFSGDSVVSVSSDTKYPSSRLIQGLDRGYIAYAYDPFEDIEADDDSLHNSKDDDRTAWFSVRGIVNVMSLALLCGIVIGIFVVFPIIYYRTHNHKNQRIVDNPYINSTGQAEPTMVNNNFDALAKRSQFPFHGAHDLINSVTPAADGILGTEYNLVFSDEFPGLNPRASAEGGFLCLQDGLIDVRFRSVEHEPWARGFWSSGVWTYITDSSPILPTSLPFGSIRSDHAALFELTPNLTDSNRDIIDSRVKYEFDYIRIYERRELLGYSCSLRFSDRYSVAHLLSML